MNIKFEIEQIKTDWKDVLLKMYENDTEYFLKIESFLKDETDKFEDFLEIYPPNNLIFNCFNYFNVEDLKVIILGQDPYHGPNQAMGLSFSVSDNIKTPPSLKRIFKEIEDDLDLTLDKNNGNLEKWANQGVLLLNTALTVRQSNPGSHSSIWIQFTNKIIEYINKNSNQVIYMLWGNHAKKYKKIINVEKHYCLEASHPSPLARSGWFGCKHFSNSNKILKDNNKKEINWKN